MFFLRIMTGNASPPNGVRAACAWTLPIDMKVLSGAFDIWYQRISPLEFVTSKWVISAHKVHTTSDLH